MNDQLQIHRLTDHHITQLKELINLFNEVFDEYHTIASGQHLSSLLRKPTFYAVIAKDEAKILGGLTAYELPNYYKDSSELYIYDIAVKVANQGQGIGKQLIEHLKEIAHINGVSNIFVDAHSEDEGAVKFWESTLGKSEKVDHFTIDL